MLVVFLWHTFWQQTLGKGWRSPPLPFDKERFAAELRAGKLVPRPDLPIPVALVVVVDSETQESTLHLQLPQWQRLYLLQV